MNKMVQVYKKISAIIVIIKEIVEKVRNHYYDVLYSILILLWLLILSPLSKFWEVQS